MSNGVIGALRVSLGLDSAQFEAGLKRSETRAYKAGHVIGVGLGTALDGLQGQMRQTASRMGIVGDALGSMAGKSLIVATAVGGMATAFDQARRAMDFADEIADTAAKLAVTTDALQEYRYAIRVLGGEVGDADQALQGFSEAFGAAQAKLTKKATKPFEALGLDPQDFATTEEAMDAVIAKIAALGSTAEQAAIAKKLGLSSILPAIREGGSRIDELREAAHRLGVVMDADLIRNAGEANDKLQDMQQIIDVQLKTAFVQLAPQIVQVSEAVADLIRQLARIAGDPEVKAVWSALTNPDTAQGFRQLGGIALANRQKVVADRKYGQLSDNLGEADDPHSMRMAYAAAQAAKAGAGGGRLKPGTGSGRSGKDVAAASEAAIANAVRDELAARMALAGDIAKLAALRLQEVDLETKAATGRLARDQAEGKITAAAAATALALTEKAASAKREAIQRQAIFDAENAELDQRVAVGRYYDDIASLEAQLVATAAERNAIEAKALADRQRLERRQEETRTAQAVLAGQMTASEQAALLASQKDQQAAQRALQARDQQFATAKEAAQREQSQLELMIDVLRSQEGAASTETRRVGIKQKILKLEQQLERLKLEEVVATTAAGSDENDAARSRLAKLNQMQDDDLKAAAGGLMSSFQSTSSALDGMASAFRSKNWSQALGNLDQALSSLKTAFGPGGTLQTKIGAISGIASAAGSMIGGTAGAGLSGAASGAMTGMMLGGPVGAAIGGVLGGLGGLFGASKAKKRAKAEAARQAAEAAAAKALEIANQKRRLEIAILEAGGKSVEALAKSREMELEGIDESNRELQKQLWSLQDAADAAAKATEAASAAQQKAADIANERRGLEIELLEATGDAAGALALKRQAELAAVDDANLALQHAVHMAQDYATSVAEARDALARAYEKEAAELQGVIDKYAQHARSLREYQQSLSVTNGAGQSMAAAAAAFQRTAAAARLGDEDALGKLHGVSEAYRTAAKAQAKTLADQLKVDSQIRVAVGAAADTAERQAGIAEQQLDALKAQVGGLITLNTSVLSVRDAVLALKMAEAAKSDVTVAASADYAAYVQKYPDLLAAYEAYGAGRGQSMAQFGLQHWVGENGQSGQLEGRTLPGFAKQGTFRVGGTGNIDGRLAQMRLSPAEMVTVTHGDPQSETRALRSDVNAIGLALAKNTAATATLLKRWEGNGLPQEREAA